MLSFLGLKRFNGRNQLQHHLMTFAAQLGGQYRLGFPLTFATSRCDGNRRRISCTIIGIVRLFRVINRICCGDSRTTSFGYNRSWFNEVWCDRFDYSGSISQTTRNPQRLRCDRISMTVLNRECERRVAGSTE